MTVPGSGDVPKSSEEAFRRAALFASGLLALRESPRLRELLEALSHAANVPVAGICVLEGDHCWVPVVLGLDLERMPSSESLSAQVAQTQSPVVMADLRGHPELSNHPVVRGSVSILSFAAAPLTGVQNVSFGALFIADHAPRPDFDVIAIPHLKRVADDIMREAGSPHHMRRAGRTTVEGLEALIRQATRDGDDELVTAIDRVMRDVLPLTGIRGI